MIKIHFNHQFLHKTYLWHSITIQTKDKNKTDKQAHIRIVHVALHQVNKYNIAER